MCWGKVKSESLEVWKRMAGVLEEDTAMLGVGRCYYQEGTRKSTTARTILLPGGY